MKTRYILSKIKNYKKHLLFIIFVCVCLYFLYNSYYRNPKVRELQHVKIEQFQTNLRKTKTHFNKPSAQVSHLDIENRKEQNIKLFQLYSEGVPSRYDEDGNTIEGVEPDATQALIHLRKAIRLGWGDEGKLELAKLLHQGMHNLPPDLYKAKRLYVNVLRKTTNPEFRLILKEQLTLVDQDIVEHEKKKKHQRVLKWLNLPENDDNTTPTLNPTPIEPPQPEVLITNIEIDQIAAIPSPVEARIAAELRDNGRLVQTPVQRPKKKKKKKRRINPNELTAIKLPKVKNDAQNVHDSTLLSTIKKSIDKIRNSLTRGVDVGMCVTEVRQFVNSKIQNDKRCNALKALDSIEQNTSKLVSTNIKESDALALVWARIHEPANDETREQLKECLFDELSECVEHGKVVCSTGRCTRIIDTLNVIDPLVQLKPTFVVREEMLRMAAKIRGRLWDQLKESEKQLFQSDPLGPKMDQFDQKTKRTIERELRDEYVGKGIMTSSRFDIEIKKWIDDI